MFLDFCSVGIPGHDEYDEIPFIIGIIKGGSQLVFVFKRKRNAVFTGYQECLLMLGQIFVQCVTDFGETVHI